VKVDLCLRALPWVESSRQLSFPIRSGQRDDVVRQDPLRSIEGPGRLGPATTAFAYVMSQMGTTNPARRKIAPTGRRDLISVVLFSPPESADL